MTQTSFPAATYGTSEFRVGRVIDRSFKVFTRNFIKFVLVTAVAAVPGVYFQTGMMSSSAGASTGASDMMHIGVAAVVVWLLAIVLSTLSQAVVLYGTFQDMRGRPVVLGDALRVGLSRFFPLIGLAICSGIALLVGFLLLLVPGFILLAVWYVATPACVVERRGPIESMSRSADLTRGFRWKVFGLIVVLALAQSIAGGSLTAVVAKLSLTVNAVVLLVWGALFGAYSAIAVAVTYHDLRVAKEGIDIERITAVFD